MKQIVIANLIYLIIAFTIPVLITGQEPDDTLQVKQDTGYFVPGDSIYNLLMAAEMGDSASVLLLLDKGVDVNTKTWDEVTPLMYAAGNGHLGTVRLLVEHGALINEKPGNEMSAILSAAQFNHMDVVEFLILRGAYLNDQDEEGATALMYAAAYNYYILADMLLFYGADTEVRDEDGNTALMVASHAGNTEMVDLLLINQAVPDPRDNEGNTPLMVASGHGYADIVQTLIEFNVEIDAQNNEGMTALAFASRKGHQEVVEKLLYYGANPNPGESRSTNAMFLAKKNNHAELVTILKEAGAKPIAHKLEINRMGLAFDMNWNLTDFMYGGSIDIQNDQWGVDIRSGYLTRAGFKRILVEKDEHSYYQLFEKRSLAYLEGVKRIGLGTNSNSVTHGIFVGGKGLYTYGHYRAVQFYPDNRLLFAPEIGYYSLGRHATMKISYEYMDFDLYKVSPHRINISLAILINFKQGNVSDYSIKWLD